MWKIIKATWDLTNAPVETEEDKKALIWASYLFPFTLIPVFVWISYESADMFNTYLPLSPTIITYIQMSAVAVFSIGTYGSQADRITTWGRNSHAEKLNAKIFRLITASGIYLTFFAYLLRPAP